MEILLKAASTFKPNLFIIISLAKNAVSCRQKILDIKLAFFHVHLHIHAKQIFEYLSC